VTPKFTKAAIEDAFDLMGNIAADRGTVLEIAVYGGSCLMLASNLREASGDIDAVFLSDRTEVQQIADQVAKQLRMPEDWLNQAVKLFAPPKGNPPPTLLPFGDYPRDSSKGVGLRVHLPTPEYMLAMKILSNRSESDLEKLQTDQNDAVALMAITRLTTAEQLTDLLKQCYPQLPGMLISTKLNPRLDAKIRTLTDAYATHGAAANAAWHARRGRPVGGIGD